MGEGRPARAPRLPAAERRTQLLDLAEGLFIERGYASVTMEDIAKAAGVTRPVVYDNLGSREGAFLACVQRARDSHERRLLENIDPDSHPRDQLVAGSRAFFGMLQEHPGRWKLLFGGDAGLPADATQQIMALRFATIEQIRLVLVAAAPNSDPERLEAAAHVAYGAAEGLGFWWLSRPEVTLDAVVEHCTEVLWRGLAPYTEE